MGKRKSSDTGPIQFTAALADGRTCLGFDREGESRLTLIVSQQEAAIIAQRLVELMDTSFVVTLVPE